MRKIPLIIGVILLLIALGYPTGVVTLEFYTSRSLSDTKTLDNVSPSPQWVVYPIDLSTDDVVRIKATCVDADDRVTLGLMTEALFETEPPWPLAQFETHSTGNTASIEWTTKTTGSYRIIVQGREIWPITYELEGKIKTPRGIAPYFAASLAIVGAILIALSWYRRRR